MKVEFTPKAKQWREEEFLLQQASELLEELIGPSHGQVGAEWDRAEDETGKVVYTLRLSDWAGSVTGVFSPRELGQNSYLRQKLNRLWGDLLQIRSHKQLEELLETETSREV